MINEFNDRFGILIDFCEEDEIKAENVGEALEIAKRYAAGQKDATKKALAEKVVEALSFAQSLGMPAEFYF